MKRLSGLPRESELPSSAHEGVYLSAKRLMTGGFQGCHEEDVSHKEAQNTQRTGGSNIDKTKRQASQKGFLFCASVWLTRLGFLWQTGGGARGDILDMRLCRTDSDARCEMRRLYLH